MTVATAPLKRQLVDLDGLRALGLTRHRVQIHRDVQAGHFPAPVKVGQRNYWLLDEVEQWLAGRVADRDRQVEAVGEARGVAATGR